MFGCKTEVKIRTAIRCEDCAGSGAAAGTKSSKCTQCGGTGQVRRVRQSILGQMVTTAACAPCSGSGEVISTPCATCRGDGRILKDMSYQVDVPAGVDNGQTLRLSGRGAVGFRGGASGDLYVHIRVAEHATYRREDDDLVADVVVSIAQAALGTQFTLTTLDGDEELIIPAGVQHGREFVLRGRGVPRLAQNGRSRGRGNLRARVSIEVPSKLSATEEELLRRYAEERGEHVGNADNGIMSRIKSAFS